MSFRFHPKARDDLQSLHDYIARDDPGAAANLIDSLHRTCRLLADTPYAGRPRPDLHEQLRSFHVGNYILIYRVVTDGVEIVYVADGRRHLPALLERERR